MHIYCINLAKDLARRENVLAECKKYGLQVEFITAIDGAQLNEDQIQTLVFDPENNALSRGEIGCALSHLKAYEMLIASGYSKALILEDDICIVADPRRFLNATEAADGSAPEIYLLTEHKSYRASRGKEMGGMEFFPLINGHSAHAYVITIQAARNLTAALKPVYAVADFWKHFMVCDLVRIWVCEEVFIKQNATLFPSYLTEGRAESFGTKKRKQFTKRVRKMAPLFNRVKYHLWRLCLPLFEKIRKTR